MHLTAMEQVLERFTSAATPDTGAISEQLGSRESAMYVRGLIKRRAMTGGDADVLIPGTELGQGGEYVAGTYWEGTPEVFLDSVHDARAVGIGDHVWSLARVRWVAVGRMRVRSIGRYVGVPSATTWETLVLLSPSHEERKLVVLESEPPSPSSQPEICNLPPELVARLPVAESPYSRHRVPRSRLEAVLESMAAVDNDLEASRRRWRDEREAEDQDSPGLPL